MALPTSQSGYEFEDGDKDVSVGDPTEAEEDHNTLAENTDWLHEAKISGWRGNSLSDETRICDKTGTVQIWAGNMLSRVEPGGGEDEYYGPISLHDVSAVPIVTDLRYRLVRICGDIIMSSGTGDNYLPRGQWDDCLSSDNDPPGSEAMINVGPITLYTGPGSDVQAGDAPADYFKKIDWSMSGGGEYEIYFWVSSAAADAGDLKFSIIEKTLEPVHSYDEVAFHFVIDCGPKWNAAS